MNSFNKWKKGRQFSQNLLTSETRHGSVSKNL